MNALFLFFAIASCFGAVLVVISQSVVRMAFWLVVSLGSVAALFFLADADFVGAAQLLIYVGGTLVLLVFGVMLTASGPYMKIETSPGETAIAGVVGSLFLFMVISSTPSGSAQLTLDEDGHTVVKRTGDWEAIHDAVKPATSTPDDGSFDDKSDGNTLRPIGWALLGLRPDRVDITRETEAGKKKEAADPASGPTAAPGYLLPFEIASVHLLVVLIGAAYLARAKRRSDEAS